MSKSQYEQMLFDQIVAAGLPEPEREIRFHETRRWRLDIGDRTVKLAVEVEGQVWGRLVKCHRCGAQVLKRTKSGKMVRVREAGGRHTRGDGFSGDVEKYNEAVLLGWRVLKATPAMIKDGRALEWWKRGLESEEGER